MPAPGKGNGSRYFVSFPPGAAIPDRTAPGSARSAPAPTPYCSNSRLVIMIISLCNVAPRGRIPSSGCNVGTIADRGSPRLSRKTGVPRSIAATAPTRTTHAARARGELYPQLAREIGPWASVTDDNPTRYRRYGVIMRLDMMRVRERPHAYRRAGCVRGLLPNEGRSQVDRQSSRSRLRVELGAAGARGSIRVRRCEGEVRPRLRGGVRRCDEPRSVRPATAANAPRRLRRWRNAQTCRTLRSGRRFRGLSLCWPILAIRQTPTDGPELAGSGRADADVRSGASETAVQGLQSQASARARRNALSRALRVSVAAAVNSERASANRPARNRKSPLAAGNGA